MSFVSFPPPKDPEEFERLVEQIAGPALRSSNVSLNGRRGQAQRGVDISVRTDEGEDVGIQCKLVAVLSIKVVEAEIGKASQYSPPLDRFIIATSAPNDANLQAKVRNLNPGFDLQIWSWDKINDYLNRLPGVGLDYIQHLLVGGAADAEHQHAQHLREALDRPALLYGVHAERSFDEQRDALRDISKFLRTGLLYTRDGSLVTGLPYRRYSEAYSKALDGILTKIASLDSYIGKNRTALADIHNDHHHRAFHEVETRRIAVVEAANSLLVTRHLPRLRLQG